MKKRIVSILLALCMVLCFVPVETFADGETTEKVGTEQELINALADGSVDNIILKNDIAINNTLTVDRKVTLDLYGYMLEMKGSGSVIAIQDGGHLTLEDSDPNALYMFAPDANGLWKWVASGGTKAVRGGVIYGGTGTVMGSFTIGGGVYVYDGGRFTMNGGSIVGCTAAGPVAYGGGVCIYGTFTMTGGNIVGCTAVGDYDRNPVAYGGGVYVTGIGTFTMTGGSIIGCTATSGSGMFANGGGIYNIGDTTLSGTAEIRDCHVKGTVGMYGGGISSGDGPLNINGDVKVSDCTAGGQGSDAVFIYRGTVSSGTFYGSVTNWAAISGGTFYDSVTNYRTISGGMFYGGISNYENRGKIDGLTVTYKVNGADYATHILRSGAAATKPDDPTAEDGYVFAGWYNGDTAYDFTVPVTGDITLTAKWVKIADKTADFTASDGGAAAIALLNGAKIGAEDSTWNNDTKTLILKGIYFATTATTAVKLPDGATVILADGAENRIIGGGATVTQDGKYQKQIYIYGIYAAGALTIQGETKDPGTLFINSGDYTNNGNAWTYSAALYADGDLTVKGGAMTAQGGRTSSTDCAFSLGVQLSEGHSLSVSGGTLTGIGGESFDTEDPSKVRESFSEGFDIYRGNVTASGNGSIIGKTISEMINKDLSYGFRIVYGNIDVSDSAAFTATSTQAICIFDGDIKLSGGKLSAFNSNDRIYAITISKGNPMINFGNENIEITGGELECVGGIYISVYPKSEKKGIFSVTNGKVTADKIYGPDRLKISGGTVKSGKINADTVELQGGSLTVREPVRKYPNKTSYAIYCENLTVSGGVLDAAWDWGEYPPIVFPADSYWGYAEPLIKLFNGTASFSGGTVMLDTGCAGNTAIKAETLNLSGGVVGSGYTNEDGSDSYIQKDSDTPVKFVVYPADYTGVDAALNKVKTLDKNLYKDFSAVETAVNAVVRGKNIDEQADVDAMAKAIEDAVAALEYKDADYSKVDEAIAKANALNKDDYKDFSAVQAAIDAVVRGKNITEQKAVDAMAKAIEDAIGALEKKPAETKPEQGEPPRTGDNVNLTLWLALFFVSGGVCTALTVKRKKSYRHGGNMR